MSTMRPEQIKETGVFIPAVDPETNEQIAPTELLARLGELGYRGAIIDTSEIIPEELLPFDPETDGSLGSADYGELAGFVMEQGSKIGLATQIWNQFSAVSARRAINNRFWQETIDLRKDHAHRLEAQEAIIDDLSDKVYGYPEGKQEENSEVRAELEAARESQAVQVIKFGEKLISIHDSITGQKTLEVYASRKLGDIFHGLKSPAEMGQPFVFVRKDDGEMTPLIDVWNYGSKRKSYTGMVMDLTEAYKVFVSKEVFPYNDNSQKLPQLTLKFLNQKVQALQSN